MSKPPPPLPPLPRPLGRTVTDEDIERLTAVLHVYLQAYIQRYEAERRQERRQQRETLLLVVLGVLIVAGGLLLNTLPGIGPPW